MGEKLGDPNEIIERTSDRYTDGFRAGEAAGADGAYEEIRKNLEKRLSLAGGNPFAENLLKDILQDIE
jgi:hypothetical protein